MKKPCLLGVLFLITFLISGYRFPTPFLLKNSLAPKRIDDKYALNIDQSTISPLKDTLLYGEKVHLMRFVLRLTNNTNDTLKYMSMSCEWWAIYRISDNHIGMFESECEKNIPVIIRLPPHQTGKINFPLRIAEKTNAHGQKFRIGMNLVMYRNSRQIWKSSIVDELRLRNNLIWSNEVMIP